MGPCMLVRYVLMLFHRKMKKMKDGLQNEKDQNEKEKSQRLKKRLSDQFIFHAIDDKTIRLSFYEEYKRDESKSIR